MTMQAISRAERLIAALDVATAEEAKTLGYPGGASGEAGAKASLPW